MEILKANFEITLEKNPIISNPKTRSRRVKDKEWT